MSSKTGTPVERSMQRLVRRPRIKAAVDYVELPLRSGGVALVDAKDADKVSSYKWTWMPNRGVAAYYHDQTILLHNLIAPYARVKFKDGDKHNCRRGNLTTFKADGVKNLWKLNPRLKNAKHFYELKDRLAYEVRRKVVADGEIYQWATTIFFGYKREKDQALVMTQELAKAIHEMPKENFIQFVIQGRNKKTTNEIISEWSMWQGATLTHEELCQLGVFHRKEN